MASAGLAPRGRGARPSPGPAARTTWSGPTLSWVTEAGRLLDRLDAIAETIEVEGLTTVGSVGQIRPHPLLAEQPQTALVLARLLDALGLTDPVEQPNPERAPWPGTPPTCAGIPRVAS